MTRSELIANLRAHGYTGSDDELVAAYFKAQGQQSQQSTEPSGFKVLPTTIRLIPSVAGSVLGAAGGPVGEAIGGAAGAGVGETAGQLYEYLSGGTPFRPKEIAAATAVGAIPLGGEASILKSAGKGALVGAASSAIHSAVEKGELPDPLDAALSGVAGGVFGAGGAALGKALASKLGAKLVPEAEQAVESHVHPADTIKIGPPPTAEEVQPQAAIDQVKQGLRQVNPTPGFDYPGARPRTEAELRSFKSVVNFPEDQRENFLQLLDQSNQQRRGVQPIARMEAAASQRIVPLDLMKPGSTMKAEDVIAHRNAWTSIQSDINELEPKVAAGQASPADLLAYQQKLDQAKVIGLNWTGATTEAARVLRVQQEQAQKVALMDSEKLATLLKAPKYQNDLTQLAKDRQVAAGDPRKELELFLKNRQPGGFKYTQAYLYNSILSGIKTPLRKTIGDTMNLVANFASHPFAVAADVTRHQLTGVPREVWMGELPHQLVGVMKAVPEGLKEMLFVLGHGYSLKNVEQFVEEGVDSIDRIPTELPGGYLTNFPLRNLKGVTAFFHELAYNQELYGAAYAKARQSGARTPGQIQQSMLQLLTGTGETSEQVFASAQKAAQRTTFMDPAGKLLRGFMDLKSDLVSGKYGMPGKAAGVAMTFIAPVVRLPGKILQRGFETSPVGFMMSGAKAGGREGAQALGRASMGTMALAPFMALAAMGKLSGSGPQDPKQRDALYEKGWRPNSVKVGDTWVEFHLMQPFATELAIAASAFDRFNESPKTDQDADNAWAMAERALTGAGRSTLDQSYFSSLSSFFRAMEDPSRSMGSFLKGVAQDVVPYSGLNRNLAQAMDPVVRKPNTLADDIKTIIPGLSQDVPAKLTRFGEPATRPGGPLQRGVNPIGISPETPDAVQDLLDQLKVKLGAPTGRLTLGGKPVDLRPEQKQALEQAQGQAHRQVLERMVGQRVSEKQVKRALANATRQADAQFTRRLKASQVDALYELYQRGQQ